MRAILQILLESQSCCSLQIFVLTETKCSGGVDVTAGNSRLFVETVMA